MSECIEWHKARTVKGYGTVRVGGRRLYAHRLAYCKANGLDYDDIKGKIVMHTCDNPPCCNPAHLKLGTHEDNVADRVAKGRSATGVAHGLSKLDWDKVAEIRALSASGATQRGLGKLYGVASPTIHQILHNRTWKLENKA